MNNDKTCHFIVKGEVYPFDVLVSCGERKSDLRKKLTDVLPNRIVSTELKINKLCSGRTIMFSTGQVLLWLKEKPTTVDGLAILSHEIFHCAFFILNRIGIEYSSESDEAYAYFIQHLTKKIYENIDITFS